MVISPMIILTKGEVCLFRMSEAYIYNDMNILDMYVGHSALQEIWEIRHL